MSKTTNFDRACAVLNRLSIPDAQVIAAGLAEVLNERNEANFECKKAKEDWEKATMNLLDVTRERNSAKRVLAETNKYIAELAAVIEPVINRSPIIVVQHATHAFKLIINHLQSAGCEPEDADDAAACVGLLVKDHAEAVANYKTACIANELCDKQRAEAEHERDEARDTIVALTTAGAEKDLEIATLTRERDEAREEAAVLADDLYKARFERDEARAEVERLTSNLEDATATVDHAYREGGALYLAHIAQAEAEAALVESRAEVERLSDASTHWQVMLKRETEEVEHVARKLHSEAAEVGRLTFELLNARLGVRSAIRESYRRGAEAMREACAARLIAASIDKPSHAITREHAAEIVCGTPITEEP